MAMKTMAAPELLAPAGDWEALRAAVANGADAVYFGLETFNARHRATNFKLRELPTVLEYLHRHNVRGIVTFNTLVFSDELPAAQEYLRAIAGAGVDAIIVQDLGAAELAHRLCPGVPLHASTQMTLSEPWGIAFVKRLGIQRIVLARELGMKEIGKITAATDVPIEVFVHGALCVSYSGQCLTSESLGGRSANRGQCAQACRLPYELIVDGRARDLGDKAYLLSPGDLAAYDLIGELLKLGVRSFKIEGRLKSAHYVAAACQTYRAAIDAAAAGREFALGEAQRHDLEQTFSRGFTHGFLEGVDHQSLVAARFPKARGTRIGTVVGRGPRGVVIETAVGAPVLKPGDGVVFDEGHPEQDEQGGRIFAVKAGGREQALEFRAGDVNLSYINAGAIVWKTDDPAIKRRLEHSFSRDVVAHRAALDFTLRAHVGESLELIGHAGEHEARATWDEKPLEAASRFPITEEAARQQLDRLGDTPFALGTVRVESRGGAMVPRSVLNELRRRVCEKLMRLRARRWEVAPGDVLGELRRDIGTGQAAAGEKARLYVLARSMEQLEALLAMPAETRPSAVYVELEDVRGYPQAVEKCRRAGVAVGLATIRIVKPGEEGFLKQVGDCAPDMVLARSLGAVGYYRRHLPGIPLIGDYALNAANELTAGLLLREGLARVVPSYDLNWTQLAAMVGRFDAGRLECVIHQHMPMFHMEHCVFAHTLSSGRDFRDCGRPCEAHRVELRDRMGENHPLLADVGCRNTLYNAQAQTAAEYVPGMLGLGLRHFRVELLRENGAEAAGLAAGLNMRDGVITHEGVQRFWEEG